MDAWNQGETAVSDLGVCGWFMTSNILFRIRLPRNYAQQALAFYNASGTHPKPSSAAETAHLAASA